MNIAEGVLIAVTFAAPVAAVQAQKWIERHREKRRGKDYVFRTLMATRAARVSAEHVQALNMIDLEFYGGGTKEKKVREVWKQYLDHLNTRYDKEAAAAWGMRQDELFVDLLYEMANCLGYDFDKTHIKNSSYSPVAHGNLGHDQNLIRWGLVKILTGNASIPVTLTPRSTEDAEAQAEVQRLLLENLRGQRPYLVKIANDNHPDDAPTLSPPVSPKALAAASEDRKG
jgi:hypothetical protein